jgi:drug/metabolite transporter (DMT)-like permease
VPVFALLTDWALTASWPIIGKDALRSFDAGTFLFLANLLGFLTLLPFLLRQGRLRRILGADLRWRLFWLGCLGTGIPSFLQVLAVGYTTPANAAIVAQVEILYSLGLAVVLLRERITGQQIAGTCLVLAGTGLVLAKDLGSPHWKGDLILLSAPWMFQLSHVISKRLPPDVDHFVIAGARLFYSLFTLAAFSGAAFLFGAGRAVFSPHAAGLLSYQAVLLGSLNMWLWYAAIRRLDLSKATAVLLSYPALTLAYSWALGLERLGWNQYAGLVLALAGALWITLQMKTAPVVETSPGIENAPA